MSQGVVGTLSTIDPDVEDAFSYEILPEGDGTQFQISGNQLLAAAPGLNYEAGATRSVSIRTTDAGGLSVSRTFAIQVTNVNEPPTDIILTGAAVPEHVPLVVVGTLSAVDPEGTSFFTYEILPGGDGALFQIQGDQLRVGAIGLDYEAGATRNVIVRVRDASFVEFYDEVLVVQIANVDEAPTITSLNLSLSSITSGDITTVFGTFSDADFGDTHTVVIDWGLGEAPTTIVNSSLTDAGDNDPTTKGFSASHQYLSVNQYNVSAKVIDGDGSVVTASRTASKAKSRRCPTA